MGHAYHSPINYYTLGATYPRAKLREPYPRRVNRSLVQPRPPLREFEEPMIFVTCVMQGGLEMEPTMKARLEVSPTFGGGLELQQ